MTVWESVLEVIPSTEQPFTPKILNSENPERQRRQIANFENV